MRIHSPGHTSTQQQAGQMYTQALVCVMFYFCLRDGVGDGQIQFVVEHELQSMLSALKTMTPQPKLTFIVVSKRINSK